jgi:pheromone shutdown protein TraB
MNKAAQVFKHFFSYDFQIYINRIRFETVDKVFVGLAIAFCLLALVAWIAKKATGNPVTQRLMGRWFVWAGTVGLAGLAWSGARYQLVGLFGTHLAFLILLVAAGIWKLYIVKYMFRTYPAEKAAWEKQQLKEKYLK